LLVYTANPTMQHITALKHVLRYLSGTRSYAITYNNVLDHPNHFFGYTDAAFISKKNPAYNCLTMPYYTLLSQ